VLKYRIKRRRKRRRRS